MKSPISVSVAALGSSPWLVLDYLERPFNVGLFASLGFNSVLTYKVQHTPDNPNITVALTVARAGTVATATFASPHNLSVGDSIVVAKTGDANLNGTYAVASVPSATTLTYTVANTGAAASGLNAIAALMRVYDHAYMTGLNAKADGNYGFPCMATRVTTTAYTSGSVTLEAVQGNARG